VQAHQLLFRFVVTVAKNWKQPKSISTDYGEINCGAALQCNTEKSGAEAGRIQDSKSQNKKYRRSPFPFLFFSFFFFFFSFWWYWSLNLLGRLSTT
jgi:hypothetical protein